MTTDTHLTRVLTLTLPSILLKTGRNTRYVRHCDVILWEPVCWHASEGSTTITHYFVCTLSPQKLMWLRHNCVHSVHYQLNKNVWLWLKYCFKLSSILRCSSVTPTSGWHPWFRWDVGSSNRTLLKFNSTFDCCFKGIRAGSTREDFAFCRQGTWRYCLIAASLCFDFGDKLLVQWGLFMVNH